MSLYFYPTVNVHIYLKLKEVKKTLEFLSIKSHRKEKFNKNMSLTLNCLFLIITIVFFVKGQLNRSISTCSAPLCPRKQNTNSSCSSTNTQICHAYTIALTLFFNSVVLAKFLSVNTIC